MAAAKPTRTALEVFLLALIREGVDTIYKMRQGAGLSVGGTQPALKRLFDDGLIRKAGKPGDRNRQAYALTADGRELAVREWRNLVLHAPRKPVADSESILRLVALARTRADRELVRSLLERAAADRNSRNPAASSGADGSVAARYLGLLRRLAGARLATEAAIFDELRAEFRPNRRR